MVDIIISIRIICSITLFFFQVFLPAFYVLYYMSGLTDIIDGVLQDKRGQLVSLERNLSSLRILFL